MISTKVLTLVFESRLMPCAFIKVRWETASHTHALLHTAVRHDRTHTISSRDDSFSQTMMQLSAMPMSKSERWASREREKLEFVGGCVLIKSNVETAHRSTWLPGERNAWLIDWDNANYLWLFGNIKIDGFFACGFNRLAFTVLFCHERQRETFYSLREESVMNKVVIKD